MRPLDASTGISASRRKLFGKSLASDLKRTQRLKSNIGSTSRRLRPQRIGQGVDDTHLEEGVCRPIAARYYTV